MPRYKLCLRNHPQSPANTRIQHNSWRKKNGKVTRRRVKVCLVCRKWRAKRHDAGLPVKDLRRGKR